MTLRSEQPLFISAPQVAEALDSAVKQAKKDLNHHEYW
jgi:hypothetical protein